MDIRQNVILFNVILIVLALTQNVTSLRLAPANQLVSYSLPEARELKRALGFNEDTYFNFTELTTKYGYQSDQHTVKTDDGYILTMFRILPKCNGTSKPYPILLVHGIVDTSDTWILSGEEFGLGYVLARNCYDVWAANTRGNRYSRRHVHLNPDKDIAFWEYTFEEQGYFDIPAFIDYILRVTNKPKLFYAAHSQGTTNFFTMASLKPEYNKKVQLSILLAPVAWMTNAYSPILRAIIAIRDGLKEFLDGVGYRELLARHQLIHFVLEIICHLAPELTCGNILVLGVGQERGSVKPETLAVSFGHVVSGTSSKNLLHYGQLFVSRRFKRYDEGVLGNMKRYGLPKPPDYKVSQISSPVVLISARHDWISSLKDVETLCSKLPNLVDNYIVPVRNWSHLNHLWDERVKTYVIPKFLDYLGLYSLK
jgi:lysosomal acid lipase/cholesteryl ester hydrolase